MLKIAHSTLKSSQDDNGNHHRLYIDPFKSRSSKYFRTYSAKRFSYNTNKSADPRHDVLCVAKFPTSSYGTEQWAIQEITKSKAVRKSAESFLKTLNENGPQLSFLLPQYVTLDAVAILSKKRTVGEYVIFEDKLPNFTHFLDTTGKIIDLGSKRNNKLISAKSQLSSSRGLNNNVTFSEDQESYEHIPIEGAIPAHYVNNIVIPTCPPWEDDSPPREDDSPPSYDQLFVNSSDQNDLYQCQEINRSNSNIFHFPEVPYVNTTQFLNYAPCLETNYCCNVDNQRSHCKLETSNLIVQDGEDNTPHPLLRAFVHFDYCLSNGQRIVSNLKGTNEHGEKYTLTTPTVHSLTRSYGERDMGETGMVKAIENHKCSRWCQDLPSMRQVFQDAQINATFNMNSP